MTTYTFTGYQVTTDVNGVATAAAASTFSMTATDTFFMRYTLTNPPATGFAPITFAPTTGAEYKTVVDGARVAITGTASVAEFTWTSGKTSQVIVFEVPGEIGVKHIFQLAGSTLPNLTTATGYNDFMATVTATKPVLTGLFRPGNSVDPVLIKSLLSESADDTLVANAAFDSWTGKVINTGIGNDHVTGLATADKVDLGAGHDVASGLGGNDTLIGNYGDDSMGGGDQNDLLSGGSGNDNLYGGNDNDKLDGGIGSDYLSGGSGTDALVGYTGNDIAYGGADNDSLYGGDGNDFLDGDSGDDVIAGGNGLDTVVGDVGNDKLSGYAGADIIYGGSGADVISGGDGNDYVDGGSENEAVTGGAGNDSLHGSSGNDTLHGGIGDDDLYGGTGNDRLTGYSGADDFFFSNGSDADLVVDFLDNIDQLVISDNLGVETVAEALAAATQVGLNVVFDFGDGDILTVRNMTIAALSNDLIIQL